MCVAEQIARLCGDDSQMVTTWRSLADAVGREDRARRTMSYTQRGVNALIDAGWLEVETIGKGRAASTTWRLIPGDREIFAGVPLDWLQQTAA